MDFFSTSVFEGSVKSEKISTNDSWVVNTSISDVYDFNPVNPQTYKGAITKLPAGQAHKDQGSGILSNYNVNIQFSDKINK